MTKKEEQLLAKLNRNVAAQVKSRRGEASQRELARTRGIDQGFLSRVESGKARSITLAGLVQLAHAVRCDPLELLEPVSRRRAPEPAES